MLKVIILFGLIIAYPIYLFAEPIQLQTITVTSNKSEKALKEDISNTTIISEDEIQRIYPKDIMDLIRFVPGMTLNNMGTGSYYIGFRGTAPAPKGTMIMLDGIEINTAANYILAQNIPIADIERIEIIKNPSSALYGPAGVGGIINIITKKARLPYESQISLSYGSFAKKEALFLCKGYLENGFSYGLSTNVLDTDGYRDESNTRYQIISPRLGYDNDQLHFEFISVIKPSKGKQPGGLLLDQYQTVPKQASSPDSTGNGYATTWGVKIDYHVNSSSKLRLKSSYRTDDWHSEMDGNYLEGDDQRHWTAEVNYQFSHVMGNFKNTFLSGIEYRNYQSNYTMHPDDFWADKTFWWESANTIDENIVGFFIQYDTRFAEKLSIHTGVRLDRIQMKYVDKKYTSNNIETTHRKSSPKIGFSFSPFDSLDFFGNYTQGIRSVNLVETVWTPKDHLKPEKIENYELGARGFFLNDFHFNMAFFFTQTSDYIIESGTGQTLNWENSGSVQTKGVEISAGKLSSKKYYLNVNYTFQQSDYKDYRTSTNNFSNKTIPLVPKHMAGVNFGFNIDCLGKIDTSVRYIDDKYIDNQNNLRLDSYTVVDVKYTYHYQMIDLTLSVNNFFDTIYAEYGKMNGGAYVNGMPVAYPSEGRSIIGAVSWKF